MNSLLVSSILVFALGVGVGILLQRYVIGRANQSAKLESELANLQGEHLHLKSSLEQHFHQTADLTRNLTNNYKALYEHLARGADDFTQMPLTDLEKLLDTPRSKDMAIDYAAAGLDPQAVDESTESAEMHSSELPEDSADSSKSKLENAGA